MGESVEEIFSRTLKLLAEPNIKISDDTYLQILLSKLSKQEYRRKLVSLPICEVFLTNVLGTLGRKEETMASKGTVIVFAMQLLGVLISEEEKFSSPALQSLVVVISETDTFKDSNNCSLQLSYVAVLSSLLKHTTGTEWILEKALWRHVIRIYLQDRSIYIRRESQKFMIDLLEVSRNHSSKSEAILHDVFLTITSKKNVCGSHFSDLEGESKCWENSPLTLGIDLVSSILEASLLSPSPALDTALANFLLESWADHFLDLIPEKEICHGFITKLGKFICLYHLSFAVKNPDIANLTIFSNKILTLLYSLLKKQSIPSVLAVALHCHSCLCKLKRKLEVSFEDEQGKRLLLRDQLIYIQVVPFLFNENIVHKELNRSFLSHICETTSSKTQQLAIQLKEAIKRSNELVETAYLSLVSILKMKDLLEREPAVVVFRAMAFILWRYSEPENTENQLLVSNSPKLLGAVLGGLKSFIEIFHLTWRDSLETLCLMSFMVGILQDPNVPSKIVVECFQLMKRCIEDFIPPNLALLINSVSNSSLSQLGPLLAKRIHDPNWEVKDSVFEVLECISNIADIKFPVFQEVLLKNELCFLAVESGIADSESYVRASSLACITAMIKVTILWQESLSTINIPDRVISILMRDSEGIVRKEAAVLLTELYKSSRLTNAFEVELYKAMFEVATKDLHWEVKIKALSFWRAVTEKKLSDQGMIDGSFPTITFSKMDRKIVNLDPPKIKELVLNVLEELSTLGCLRALLMAVCDCDINVARSSVSHLSYIKSVCSQYGLINEVQDYPMSHEVESAIEREGSRCDYISIINSILSDDKDKKDNQSTENNSKKEKSLNLHLEKVLHFLTFVDFEQAMEMRGQWFEQCGSSDIVSLLEDILSSQRAHEHSSNTVNDLDCY